MRSIPSLVAALVIGAAFALVASSGARASEGLRIEVEFFEDGGDAPSHLATVSVSGRPR